MFSFFKRKPKEIDWISNRPPAIVKLMLEEIANNTQACQTTDEIPNAKGPFGLCPSNPVPVYGVPSNEVYLGRLRMPNGNLIRWRRVGSIRNEDIEKPIDDYEVFDRSGNIIAHIYISPYHWRTSLKAPDGFKIVIK